MSILTVPIESVVAPSLISATREDHVAWKESWSVFFGVENDNVLSIPTSMSDDVFVWLLLMNILGDRIDMCVCEAR